MDHANSDTFVDHGDGTGSQRLIDNFDYMRTEVKDSYKTDINDENFPEALKQDAQTQLRIIDDIEYKIGNALAAGTNNYSTGGRSNKRNRTKRRSNKRKKTKRRSNKKKH